MKEGPSIVHDWNAVGFIGPWTKEQVVDFIIEIEERVARGDAYHGERKPRLALVPGNGKASSSP